MLDNVKALEVIKKLEPGKGFTRREVSRMLDCALGNILDAQRTGRLQGTKTEVNGVETFHFSKEQLLAWRENSGKQTSFGKITILVEDKEALEKVQALLTEAGIAHTSTIKAE